MAKKSTTRKPGKKSDQVIINKIDVRPIRRTTQDVQNWRNAMIAAEGNSKNRQLLYDLYHDVMLDTHLESVIGKREDALTNAQLTFTRNGKEVEEITDLIQSPDMADLMKDMLSHKWWGYALTEITDIAYNEVTEKYEIHYDLIPYKHVKPELEVVAKHPGNRTGIPYKENPYCMWAGKKDDLGLLLKVAFWVIIKRGNASDFAQLAEMFGIPFREFRYRGNDEQTRLELEKVAQEYAGAGYALIPEEADFKLHESNSTSTGNPIHEKLHNISNAEISKGIVGQTMTTEDGSSRSQAQVHAEVEEDKKRTDKTFILNLLNTSFKRILKNYGFDVAGGEFSFVEQANLKQLKERLNIDKEVSNKVPVDDDYWYETYHVRKPKNYKELKAAQEKAKKQVQEQREKAFQEAKKQNTETRNLFQRLFFLNRKPEVYDYLKTNVVNQVIELTDAERKLIDTFKRSKVYDPDTYRQTVDELTSGLFKHLNRSTKYATDDALTNTFMELNLNRFGYDKNLATIQELNRAFTSSKSYHEFEKAAKNTLGKYNRHYMRTEYDTAVATGQNAANWNQQKQEQNIFPYLKYQTAGDDKVRHSHAMLNNKLFRVDKQAEWGSIYPPNGWNCRCEMVQVDSAEAAKHTVSDIKEAKQLLGKELNAMKKDGFDINRGEVKQVFDINKGYINRLPGRKRPSVNFTDAGQPTWSAIKKMATLEDIPMQEVEAATVLRQARQEFTRLDNGKNALVMLDYNSRPLGLFDSALKKHLTGKWIKPGEDRHKIFHLIKTTLANPDEVYLRKYSGKYQYRYTYFYNDRIMIVDTEFDNKLGLKIKTWYMDKVDESKLREGILIKKGRF